MQFLLGFIALISLAVAIHGGDKIEEDNRLVQDYIPCGNDFCHDGFNCINGGCQAKRRCAHHLHCPEDQYWDTTLHACSKGVRRCYSHRECGSGNMCKRGFCEKRKCIRHTECPDNQVCIFPPGICENYDAYWYGGHHNYCKKGFVCVNNRCKKRQCNGNYDCNLGDHCVGGFCKRQEGFCSNDSDCEKNQCCAKAGSNPHGLCKNMNTPWTDWYPLKQSVEACPCVSGYVCEKTTSKLLLGKMHANWWGIWVRIRWLLSHVIRRNTLSQNNVYCRLVKENQ